MAYKASAQFYDLFVLGKEEEQAFYQLLAQEVGSPALELGVGTGVFAFHLAEDGITVVGLEKSREMLQEARKKLQKAPPEIAKRLLFIAGDMSDFSLDQKFRFIYVPSGSFQYLTTRKEQVGCLRKPIYTPKVPSCLTFGWANQIQVAHGDGWKLSLFPKVTL
ncbi:MAG: class I SAM-dependent methyltransferase [Promethearchaeota archaeon]